MKLFFPFVGGAVLAAALLGVFVLHLPLPLLATVGLGILCLLWLVVIVVLPWNLYFQARHVLFEVGRSRARGLEVSAEQEASTRAVAKRMLRLSVALHLVSAALLGLGSWLSQEPLGTAFSALFLLSTLFRPAVEYYRYLRRQLGDVLQEIKYPRDDVARLLAEVEAHRLRLDAQQEAQVDLGKQHAVFKQEALARLAHANQRFEAVARRFDETLDRLTDNKEIISGLKAFLRLVRESPAGG